MLRCCKRTLYHMFLQSSCSTTTCSGSKVSVLSALPPQLLLMSVP